MSLVLLPTFYSHLMLLFLGLCFISPFAILRRGEFSISDPDSIITTYSHPVPSRVLPSFLFDKTGGYGSMLYQGTRFRETKGFIINTFAELESPMQLTVINFEVERHPNSENIIKWLDDQPSSSALFLCFGSMGGFEHPQIAEMAAALERSGYRFLWLHGRQHQRNSVQSESVFGANKEKGIFCVIAQEAVGGLVSHCGWNSILESLWNGVPIATWPVYAEQQSNAFQLVKDLELAMQLTLDYRFKNPHKLVPFNEIEKAIRCLMDDENPVRRRVKEIGKKAIEALMDGGSSFISLRRFIEDPLVAQK
ncbi:unnamed protein product [Coffea canephora]|uniref:DH200=94 genomic scaffold, scaffold_245 n=1 Tax=Coffea canephora TaxID=49390 RepID=A0A068VCN8_COFCA|nr:unnamed protein product [Coffea canephora]